MARPLAEALDAEAEREALHFDFLSMPTSFNGVKCIFAQKDALSGWLCLALALRRCECRARKGIIGLSSALGALCGGALTKKSPWAL